MPEMRNHVRYPIRTPVFFSWPDLAHGKRCGEGLTLDISSKGLFVQADVTPPHGMVLRVEVLLPRLNQSAVPVRIEGTGRVIRTEIGDDSGRRGFGFYSEAFVLVDLENEVRSQDEQTTDAPVQE